MTPRRSKLLTDSQEISARARRVSTLDSVPEPGRPSARQLALLGGAILAVVAGCGLAALGWGGLVLAVVAFTAAWVAIGLIVRGGEI